LNSDESIKNLKGLTRPINNINERSELLTSLDFVDYVIIFSDDTPHNILSILKPNILVKGGDYTKENIIGKEFVDDVILFDFINGKSSSNVIKQINQLAEK
jgi:D-beta-D-heptose 7-phosphate kinase/D-beta-D-heptose 1-phosphate adenosyltransferase